MALDTLKLTGATGGDLNLTGNTYALADPGWSPKVAGRRKSQIGGRGPYQDVIEEIPLIVMAATKAATKTALRDLVVAVDQAARWRRGEDIDPIVLVWTADASGATVKSTVLGYNEKKAADWLQMPVTYRIFTDDFVIGPIYLNLRRIGPWLKASDVIPSGAVTQPGVMASTGGGNGDLLSPVDVLFTGSGGNDISGGSNGYFLFANAANKIYKVEAEACTASAPGSGSFNTAVDGSASGNTIRNLQPVSAGTYSLVDDIINDMDDKVNRFAIFLNVKNLSTTINYDITAVLSNDVESYSSRTVNVDTSDQNPRIIALPIIGIRKGGVATTSTDDGVQTLTINIVPSGTSASGSDVLAVDYIVVLQLDESSRAVKFFGLNQRVASLSWHLEHELLSAQQPLFKETVAGGNPALYLKYVGDLMLFITGNTLASMIVGTTGSQWLVVDGSSPTYSAVSITMTGYRSTAYLVPQ